MGAHRGLKRMSMKERLSAMRANGNMGRRGMCLVLCNSVFGSFQFHLGRGIGVGEQKAQGHPSHFQARQLLQARHNKSMFCTLN